MKKLLLAGVIALSMGGCASVVTNISNLAATVTGTSVPVSSVLVAVNSFDALEVTATNYLRLPRCNGSTPICRSPSATKMIIPAIRSGRIARNNLEAFMAQNPGALGPSGLYNALTSVISTLQGVFAQYNIGGSK